MNLSQTDKAKIWLAWTVAAILLALFVSWLLQYEPAVGMSIATLVGIAGLTGYLWTITPTLTEGSAEGS